MTERRYACGFTLVEVLVALVVVALGLIAAFGQMSQTATTATRLRDKTLAHWIAMDQLTVLRLAGEFPAEGERTDEVEMARTDWLYKLRVSKTAIPELRRVDVSVAFADRPESVVTTVTGFFAQAIATAGGTVKVADWYFIDEANLPLPGVDDAANPPEGVTR